MARHGEWNQKGSTLSDVTAKKDYCLTHEFIIKGIQKGKLEYREGVIWGSPYLRLLRSQLEQYIIDELGTEHLLYVKKQNELRLIKKEISTLKKRLIELEVRKKELESHS